LRLVWLDRCFLCIVQKVGSRLKPLGAFSPIGYSGSNLLNHSLHYHVVCHVVLIQREFIIELFAAIKQAQVRWFNPL
jgi:hypothetical protein